MFNVSKTSDISGSVNTIVGNQRGRNHCYGDGGRFDGMSGVWN